MNEEINNILYEMVTTIEWCNNIELFDKIITPVKSVSFKNENEEFLINNISYLRENDLCKDLWYTLQEMNDFKQEAIVDIQVFMMINGVTTSKDAMRIMWSGLYG
jgi:hypothetical protein